MHDELRERGVTLVLCGLIESVRAELAIDGLVDLFGAEHLFETINDVQTAYELEAATAEMRASQPR